MGKFARPATQASSVMKAMQGSILKSVRTVANYEACLEQVAEYVQRNRLGSLRDLTINSAISYLLRRSEEVSQKQLDMERQAIQAMMRQVTGKLHPQETLTVVKSTNLKEATTRAYTEDQAAS